MRETPLITFTKADDSGCGTRDPGDLDYIVHGDALTNWLSNGRTDQYEDVNIRRLALATEMRAMADHLMNESGPVAVSIEYARKRYADRVHAEIRAANAATDPRGDHRG